MLAIAILQSDWTSHDETLDDRLLNLAWLPRADKAKGWRDALTAIRAETERTRFAVNAFDYVYLVKARNADLFFREAPGPFRQHEEELQSSLKALEALERDGKRLPTDFEALGKIYIEGLEGHSSLRSTMTRSSARDERRLLASLLCRGPAMEADLQTELSLPEGLVPRLVEALRVAIEPIDRPAGQFWTVREQALPGVLFTVRETIGLDPLTTLAS